MVSSSSSSSSTEVEQKNKQIVRQFFELLDRHDTDRIGQLLVSSTNYYFHIGGMPCVNWNEHKVLLTGVNNAFPDLHHEIVDMVAERNKVAIRLNITGTHKGEFQGIPPTGKKLSLYEMGFITIIDGKITEGWISADTMRLLQQLGVLLPSSPANTSSSSSTAGS
jgi:steroid delta-isomerase-like uncharacterized protein